jgi:hypothetical protein
VLQIPAFGGVVGQIDRAVVGDHGFLASSELVEQVRAGGPGRLEAAGVLSGVLELGVERGETGKSVFTVRLTSSATDDTAPVMDGELAWNGHEYGA